LPESHITSTPSEQAGADPAWPWSQELLASAEAALPGFLIRQRWYPAKDAGQPEVRLAALSPLPASEIKAAVAVWAATPPGGTPLHLFVPLALVPAASADPEQVISPPAGDLGDEVLVEAFSLDPFVRAWIDAILCAGAGQDGPLRAERTHHLDLLELEPGGQWPVRRGRAEQSNTSIRIGDGAILKAIRKLEQGIHPELEVGRYLTAEARFDAAPAMLGWTELANAVDDDAVTLSVLQAFVPNQGDGWSWVLERLGRPDPEVDEVTSWLRRLGRRTAEMHRAFSRPTADPAFAPEPVSVDDLQRWTGAGHAMARRALDGLAQAIDRLPDDARQLARPLLDDRALIGRQLDALGREPAAFAKTRHHGDYHLGQVLVAGDDAIIVDFEGEPLRPLAERRAKHAALRDVAGMLRSISYVAATAARNVPEAGPGSGAETRMPGWEAQASQAFLDAYFEAAAGSLAIPAARQDALRVVRFFMLEKALYEVAYELANRPDWLAIPLRGIMTLLDHNHDMPASVHRMPFGAELREDGSVRLRLWAPSHNTILVEIDGAEAVAMPSVGEGWHELVTNKAGIGSHYQFVLPDGLKVPDPASRHQPEDVHGPSEVIDPAAYRWRDSAWRGRPWHEAVVYELHIGTFTPEGTFEAAISKLDHLVSLGITAIEIMPINDFPGRRNWGYDGVLPYAPDATYGRPEDLKALVDAAHERGLMVLLDVVYNHFGPEGAYIHPIAPETFTQRHKTPWGAAINTDGPQAGPVREFFIHNAIYWIKEYHLDGLRLDAVHAILDDSPKHLLDELADRVRNAVPHRPVHLVLENEENQASRLVRDADGRPRTFTAQWNDDVHHVLHVAATDESSGYYGDYSGDTEKLGRALAQGFVFQGELMPYRGHPRGEPSSDLSPLAFVAFVQNHDQVGNRAFGDRLTAIASPEAVRAVAATYLLLPQVPMLFMGEEWGAAQPFPFFCDFGPELADAVRKGRREEFARFPEFQDPANRERIPDPMADATFASAKLVWDDIGKEPHAGWLALYRRLLETRGAEIMPRLPAIRSGGTYQVVGDGAVQVRWQLEGGEQLVLAANLSKSPVQGFPPGEGRVIWQEGNVHDETFGPYSVRWSVTGSGPAGKQRQDTALDQLAERMGIEPEFRNAHGNMVQASADTKRRLLAAMGVRAETEDEARTALEELDRAEWLAPLRPIVVVPAHAGSGFGIVLPADTGQITWRLTLEDGGERTGSLAFEELERLADREVDGRSLQRRRLTLPPDLPWGYHRLELDPGASATTLVVSPGRCWLPPVLAKGRRLWGIAVQLYLLRSATDWGIGDFGELRHLVQLAASRGADVIGLNPLHAMFQDNPEHASPYSPASRLLLNVINIDVMAIPELAHVQELLGSEGVMKELGACRSETLVDYTRVTALKLMVLEAIFRACRTAEQTERWQAFQSFRQRGGKLLDRNCLFLALREHFAEKDPSLSDWHNWPEEYRDPASETARRWAEEKSDRIEFLVWLQWIADQQLEVAAEAAGAAGMAVGLYRDLAVGADRAGAETWTNARTVISGAQVGAPPDIFNPAGQNWGLPPYSPKALREERYRSFIELVRANMRHAGGLRIDHVMALQHLYWVPQGQSPADGAYVEYPMDDLIGILALESHRHRCLVVGEDLGTVPEGFRERMSEADILSYRVLFFEQDGETGAFLPPAAYPPLAMAVVGSHDLPTLRGWWEGRDIELKEELGLFPDLEEPARQRNLRQRDRAQLLSALREEGLIASQGEPDVRELARAAHAFLARTPCALAMVQIDDLTDEADPVNVPATSDEHPNWRRRLSMTLEELAARPRFNDVAAIFQAERGEEGERRATAA
jgi:malto-oligosyltrehalose trehalohydrolase/4-alpha-glucanotransferase